MKSLSTLCHTGLDVEKYFIDINVEWSIIAAQNTETKLIDW